ncbi:MAG: HNH endonuclease [Coriobacteriaceae bacterium]|jgi:hypothetical protein|nr:HNH endonuclease [Coriobacteriaceae bacterium]
MAEIRIYIDKLEEMLDIIGGLKGSVMEYDRDLMSVKGCALKIDGPVCDLADVIEGLKASSDIQQRKAASLDALARGVVEFADEAARIDEEVADAIRMSMERFYRDHPHLRPECEKNGWDKLLDTFSTVEEWCREHWVVILTVVAVIAIAAIAVICGVAIAFIAAVAGAIALALAIADTVCGLATGGKGIADVLRENGYPILADVFQGVAIGADIVSIAFPAGAAIKTIAAVGVKTFAITAGKAGLTAIKESFEAIFRSGFKNGVRNFCTISFKTFVLNVDDFKNWRAATLKMQPPNKNWMVDGDKLLPNPDAIPGAYNPNGLTMGEIMGKYGHESIPLTRSGTPDLTGLAIERVNISMKNLDIDMGKVFNGEITSKELSNQLRNINFKNADEALLKKSGTTRTALEDSLGYKLTWHEDLGMGECFLVPREIHSNLGHTGGIGNYKFNIDNVSGQSNLTLGKATQLMFRKAIG